MGLAGALEGLKMPSELENALQIQALTERERYLEKRLGAMERMLYDFLAIASGKPGAALPGCLVRKASRALRADESIASADADEVARR